MRPTTLILGLLACCPCFGAYTFSRAVKVDHTKVFATLTNYQMTFAGTYPYLATVANGGTVQSVSGYDIVFASDTGCSSLLPFERAVWSPVTGAVEFHVQIPTLSSTADTTVYLCYDNPLIVIDQQSSPWGTNYQGVWHLPNGSSLTMADSTGNGNNGSTSTATAVSGQIDGAAAMTGSGAINIGQTASLQSPTTALTISAWVNPLDSSPSGNSVIAAQSYAAPQSTPFWSYSIADHDAGCTGNVFVGNFSVGTTLKVVCGATTWTPGTWYHVAFTFDGTTGTLYVNGVSDGSSTNSGSLAYSNGTFNIGTNSNGTALYKGSVDEVRVQSVVRNANWIKTEYTNQLNPGAFYSVSQPGRSFTSII